VTWILCKKSKTQHVCCQKTMFYFSFSRSSSRVAPPKENKKNEIKTEGYNCTQGSSSSILVVLRNRFWHQMYIRGTVNEFLVTVSSSQTAFFRLWRKENNGSSDGNLEHTQVCIRRIKNNPMKELNSKIVGNRYQLICRDGGTTKRHAFRDTKKSNQKVVSCCVLPTTRSYYSSSF
jgi:hypothetical protein